MWAALGLFLCPPLVLLASSAGGLSSARVVLLPLVVLGSSAGFLLWCGYLTCVWFDPADGALVPGSMRTPSWVPDVIRRLFAMYAAVFLCIASAAAIAMPVLVLAL